MLQKQNSDRVAWIGHGWGAEKQQKVGEMTIGKTQEDNRGMPGKQMIKRPALSRNMGKQQEKNRSMPGDTLIKGAGALNRNTGT